ncbi:hypothetical protein ACOME3_002117 [Neoechinorhynchus agilis]
MIPFTASRSEILFVQYILIVARNVHSTSLTRWAMTVGEDMLPPSTRHPWMTRRHPSPRTVNRILNDNAQTKVFKKSTQTTYRCSSIYTNYTAANCPSEDRFIVSRIGNDHHEARFLMSVFDGHGGGQCANAVSNRLHECLSMVLGSSDKTDICHTISTNRIEEPVDSVHGYDRYECLNEWRKLCDKHGFTEINEDVLKAAFGHIDRCLLNETKDAINVRKSMGDGQFDSLNMDRAIIDRSLKGQSGSCAITVYLNDDHDELIVAGLGDCVAIIGSTDPDDKKRVHARLAIEPHTAMNLTERDRVFSEHPEIERCNVVYQQRLLGYLVPFRAFGDIRLKANLDEMHKLYQPVLGDKFMLANYETPPYLTAIPETRTIKLTQNDSFLILCSDGLTDSLLVDDIVNLTNAFSIGRELLQEPYKSDEDGYLYDDNGEQRTIEAKSAIARIDERRIEIQQIFRHKGVQLDDNAATHLIRYALARNPHNIDQRELAMEIAHSSPSSIRDDMTAIVVILKDKSQPT